MRYLAICLCSILLMTAPLAAQQGNETSNKHIILEVNPLSHILGFGGTVNGSLLYNSFSLNAEYQTIGGPYSTVDYLPFDLDGYGVSGSIGWYPQYDEDGYSNTAFLELGAGYLEMDYTIGGDDEFDEEEDLFHIKAFGPMAKVGVRFILGVVTISGAINGHLYLANVDAENEEDEGGIYSNSMFMTYNLMLSFGIAI